MAARILLLDDIQLGPSDFAGWLDEIDMCACDLCTDVTRWRPLDYGGWNTLIACLVLLDALKEGRHQHKTYQQAAWDARARAIVAGTYGRPVIKVSLACAQSGAGLGMTPGGVR
jgi:hypothetical protein